MAFLDEIGGAYKKYLGRDADQGGLDYWNNIASTHGLDMALSGIAGSDEAKGKGSAEGLDLSSLESLGPKSESYTGLPDWGLDAIKDYVTKNMGGLSASLNSALQGLNSAPETIEKTRLSMIDQYNNAMNRSLAESLKPAVSNLATRGVLSSSTAEGALAKVLSDLQAKKDDQVTAANTWAGNANLNNLTTNVTAQQKQMALLQSLLESAKTSRSNSSNDLAPYSLLLPMLMGQ